MSETLEFKITGLRELQAKCKWDVLVEPPMQEAVTTVMDRPMRVRKSRQGLGIKRNSLSQRRSGLNGTVTSTLRPPRTTGAAWFSYNIAAIRKMLPAVFKKAAQRVEAIWAS